MAAKRKPDAAPDAVQELAAPAVLKRLQMDAAKFSAQIDDAEARLGAARRGRAWQGMARQGKANTRAALATVPP